MVVLLVATACCDDGCGAGGHTDGARGDGYGSIGVVVDWVIVCGGSCHAEADCEGCCHSRCNRGVAAALTSCQLSWWWT